MSWGVGGVGKSQAVRKEIASQFERGGKCAEPEETVRQSAKALLDAALAAQAETVAVKVSVHGSQSGSSGTGYSNALTILIEPIQGFVG